LTSVLTDVGILIENARLATDRRPRIEGIGEACMRGSRIFLRMISGLAVRACVAMFVSVGHAQGPAVLTKTFTGGPVRPGDSVTLEFTIVNSDPRSVAADIAFTDNLDAVVPGLVATGLPPTPVCGPGSVISGTSLLTFSGGSVEVGASCTFSVTLLVPANAAAGSHLNTTSPLTALFEGRDFTGAPATGTLAVLVVGPVVLTKTFTGGAARPGDSVTLEFTIENLDPNGSVAASIGFTDNLDVVVSGLVATGLPATNVCGLGSQISGTSLLTFSGGSLAAGASCTFSVTVLVPAGAPAGSHLNTTSPLTTQLGGTPFVGAPATGTLVVLALPAAVPTLEWWGLLLLSGLLGLAAWWGVHRGHAPPPANA
jgi:hypothetical protein